MSTPTRPSMSPQSATNLEKYIAQSPFARLYLTATPRRRGKLYLNPIKLIDVSDLKWRQLLERYSYDFDWDNLGTEYWDSLQKRCEVNIDRYTSEDYERFRIAELLRDIFSDDRDAELNFENLLTRIMEDNHYDLAKTVSKQIIDLIQYDNQIKQFPKIYEKVKTNQLTKDLIRDRLFGSTKLRTLANRCKPIGPMNFKKVTLIGAVVSLVFGISFAAWKNYY
ncbi:MAG: hypothetical protein K940chlam1_01063 [Candidatus Anoxychlamydiales bacterium]|nr:hypothetical protein [Candidatus Anoxychlamydiales bacterium]NGX36344.1 hypothetical protein [Candidatus Anoxychlamydiales bacterium]